MDNGYSFLLKYLRKHKMNEQLKLRSTISNALLTSILVKSNLIALPGVILIFAAGTWLAPLQLSSWGWAIVLLGFALIAFGLIPYKRIHRLQLQPHEIILNENSLQFAATGNSSFTVPYTAIREVNYIAKGGIYGIGIFLTEDIKEKVCVHDTNLHIGAYQEDSKARFGCDLYLPYFHQKSFNKLKAIIDSHLKPE